MGNAHARVSAPWAQNKKAQLLQRWGSMNEEPECPGHDMNAGRALAAGYRWRVLKNRPFAEGNKRMALAAMVTYLEMNDFMWKCGEVEESAMVLRASAKEIKEDEWEAWVIRNVGKKE